MPTACEPWPGNRSAITAPSGGPRRAGGARHSSHLRQARAPGEPGAEAHDQQAVALLQAALRHGVVQAQRDGGARGVAEAVHVPEDLLVGEAELRGHLLDDAQVGLVGHEQVDVGGATARRRRASSGTTRPRGGWRNGRPRDRSSAGSAGGRRLSRGWPAACVPPAGRLRKGAPLPSLPRSKAKIEPLSEGLHEHRAGAVAEQHAGATVVPVERLRDGLGAGHEHGVVDAGRHEGGGHREAVDEPGAARLHVEGAGVHGADASATSDAVAGNSMSGTSEVLITRSMSSA